MGSRTKDRRRDRLWMRYIEKTSRRTVHDAFYPFGLTIKITPGYFGARRTMRYRGRSWYLVKQFTEELSR